MVISQLQLGHGQANTSNAKDLITARLTQQLNMSPFSQNMPAARRRTAAAAPHCSRFDHAIRRQARFGPSLLLGPVNTNSTCQGFLASPCAALRLLTREQLLLGEPRLDQGRACNPEDDSMSCRVIITTPSATTDRQKMTYTHHFQVIQHPWRGDTRTVCDRCLGCAAPATAAGSRRPRAVSHCHRLRSVSHSY